MALFDIVGGGLRVAKSRVVGSAAARLEELRRRIMRRSEGEALLLERFARQHGRPLDVANPQTFTEKLYCRMIRWHRQMDPRYMEYADKLAVRSYVARKVGEQYLATLYWDGTRPRRIPFERLSIPYIIKSNHASGHFLAVQEPPQRDDVIRTTTRWLETNCYWSEREYQYFHISPRLLVEEYLSNPDGSTVNNYKFFCFGGVPHVAYVTDMANTMNPAFDTAWNQIAFSHNPLPQPWQPKPKNFEEMVAVAARLSEDFDFVRVDLFNVDGRIIFNELTFTPMGGALKFTPPEWDLTFGRLWKMRD